MITRYTTSMAKFTSSGASLPTMPEATVVLDAARDEMSPALRCEKTSMSRWSTFHMNDVLATAAILPSTRKR